MSNWLILRVFAGLPLVVEKTINEKGLATAYVPKEIIKRKHPFDRSQIIEQRKPLYGGLGFVFVTGKIDEESNALVPSFDLQAVKAAMLKANQERINPDKPNRPRTLACSMLWLKGADHYKALSERDMALVRKSETDKQLRDDVIHVLTEIANNVRMPKGRYSKDVRAVLGRAA